jgi:hypothetical protein
VQIKSLLASRPGAGHINFISYIALIFCCVSSLQVFVGGTAVDPWQESPISVSFRVLLALLASLFGGIYIGLTRFRQWGRLLAILAGMLMIAAPFSWYVLWVMFSRRTKDLFREAEVVRGIV